MGTAVLGLSDPSVQYFKRRLWTGGWSEPGRQICSIYFLIWFQGGISWRLFARDLTLGLATTVTGFASLARQGKFMQTPVLVQIFLRFEVTHVHL